MKVYFDYSVFTLQKYGGVSKYIIKLVENFSENIDPLIISPFYKNVQLNNTKKAKKFFFYNKLGLFSPYANFLNKLYLNHKLKINNPQILHYTYFNEKKFFKTKAKIVTTEYDLIKEILYKENYLDQIEFKKKLYEKSDHIICISENTKKDLMEYYNIQNKNISVVKLAVDKSKDFNNKKLNIRPFILFVGNRNRYKNFQNAIKAYSQSSRLVKDFDFVCFGGGNFSNSELHLFRHLKLSDKKVHYFTGNEFDLNFFYKSARVFIFPSLYEGFGLPLLEAMNMECPVICSNTSCFPEVVGDSAIMFDPRNIDEIQEVMHNVVYSENIIKDLKKRGDINLSKYSWKKCAFETEEIYKKL